MTLLDLAADAAALLELIDGVEELTPEVESALDGWFKEVGDAEAERVDSICCIVRTLDLRAACRREEAERLTRLVKAEENKSRRIKDRLRLYLDIAGKRRVDTARYRVTVCSNGGKAPLDLPDPASLPEEYRRVEFHADVDTIRAALESGVEVPGCALLPRGSHVRIS